MRVIGIDPGLRNMGWGVIDVAKPNYPRCKWYLQVTRQRFSKKTYSLFTELEKVFQTFNPDTAAVEQHL